MFVLTPLRPNLRVPSNTVCLESQFYGQDLSVTNPADRRLTPYSLMTLPIVCIVVSFFGYLLGSLI